MQNYAKLPQKGNGALWIMTQTNSLDNRPHIVAIGGGTGMPSLLRGLTKFTRNITAVVTVADDGGSSGRLRREMGLLPPGDFRNNIAALAHDEALMTQLLQYRFGGQVVEEARSELQGHAFGNLLLAALTGITGSFDEALLAAQRVLAMRGQVVPSTLANVTLAADVLVGDSPETAVLQHIVGESAIPKANGRIQRVSLEPATVKAYPPALKAIFQADLILMGPGSLYTSIIPNLLVPDLAQALQHARAPKVYICNLATQPGETDN
ncbi:MAG: YvcK family protein, partial [Anaerolineales bacterium]|nr:YvcK family protein [Anaerolineales bacterium]